MPIRVLEHEVASAIAAGEVVERPVSVVKELVENSIDAGAHLIEINLEAGGKRLIEVSDDGCGIPESEVPVSVHRYSTSKLSTLDDLEIIKTLGFRGEALASIGAVSRLELITRTKEQNQGIRLIVDAGKASKPVSIGAREGTHIRVSDIFFNVPARQKFMKTDLTERRRITRLITRYAMAYPSVAFRLRSKEKVRFHSSGQGDLQETLAAVYGVDIGKRLLQLPATTYDGIRVDGYVSPPDINRSNRREITTFVNGRWVQDSSLIAAILQAYHTILMVRRYPIAVVKLQLPAHQLDVNVHPTKAEVRFSEPDKIFSILQRVVRSTLLGYAPPPDIDLSSAWQSTTGISGVRTVETIESSQITPSSSEGTFRDSVLQPAFPRDDVPLLRAVGQVGACYLVAEGPDGLYLIDQHAAHERVLFERWMDLQDKKQIDAQILLEPLTIEFGPGEDQLLESQVIALQNLGFDIEPFGTRTYRLRAIPSLVAKMDPERALRVVLEDFEEDESPLQDVLEEQIAGRICTRVAIKAGQVLSLQEQQTLLRDLEACISPRTCPHGRPTMIHLSVDSLERQFRRKG